MIWLWQLKMNDFKKVILRDIQSIQLSSKKTSSSLKKLLTQEPENYQQSISDQPESGAITTDEINILNQIYDNIRGKDDKGNDISLLIVLLQEMNKIKAMLNEHAKNRKENNPTSDALVQFDYPKESINMEKNDVSITQVEPLSDKKEPFKWLFE
jgi:cobyrinic acid a,c-diamide synthase